MKIVSFTRNSVVLLTTVLTFVLLSACSDDASNATSSARRSTGFDHAHGREVTDLEKHKFEHDFAEQCVAREIKQSPSAATDRGTLEKACLCIASHMMKDLTAVEAKKFLVQKKDTQSLRIRFENAAYRCVQQRQVKN